MGSRQSWRKAYWALKDSTQVGLAKINSDFKELDVAIVKATNHDEWPPKERHIRKLFAATSVERPRADVAYCIHALARRLHKTRNWIVALKSLIVIHRTLREGDPIFREELLNYSHKGHVLQISNFKDDSSPLAWDCSAWVRTYALFLEERLECYRILKYDMETDHCTKTSKSKETTKGNYRTRDLPCNELLEQLPALQQFLFRLIGCQPEGAAIHNYLIQYALSLVLKESFKIYCAINDGIINLVDMFFDMSRHDAIKALSMYKRTGQQAENLSDFYDFCKKMDLARNFQFPKLTQPPPSFLATMEEYIKEAPRTNSVSTKALEYQERNLLIYKEEAAPPESNEALVENEEEKALESEESDKSQEPVIEVSPEVSHPPAADLLCIDKVNPVITQLDESNALALAIVPPGENIRSSTIDDLLGAGTSGWELALVTAPSSNDSHVTESKLAGGFDKLLLDSLYEDANARIHQNAGGYSGGNPTNPFAVQDPFSMSNGIAPPTNVQLAFMAQQQQQQQQYQMMMMPYNYPYLTQPPMPTGSRNPFGDPFVGHQQSIVPAQGNFNLM